MTQTIYQYVVGAFVISQISVIALRQKSDVNAASECIDGPSASYRGKRNYTASSTPCQRWNARHPHIPKQEPPDGKNHNYCRNPDFDIHGTWCYTTNASRRWEYCNISKCQDNSKVLWSTQSLVGKGTIWSRSADAEIALKFPDIKSIYNSSEYSFVWSMASDPCHEKVFFSDHIHETLSIHSMTTNETTHRLKGLMRFVGNMAYDWLTQNLYWTDSSLGSIMVVEKTMKHYAFVYHSTDRIDSLTIHPKQRKLFFSTFGNMSHIICTDLAGKREKIIISHADKLKFNDLHFDYWDNRLYWIDYPGLFLPGSSIGSSFLNGSDVKVVYASTFAKFRGIATYQDTIYVSDRSSYKSRVENRFYKIWYINKNNYDRRFFKTLNTPKAVTVYNIREKTCSDEEDLPEGGCKNMPECEHICLPRIDAPRECACSIGYTKLGETKCVARIQTENFLLIHDEGQQKLFQLSLNESRSFNVIPMAYSSSVSAMALDEVRQRLFWWDRTQSAIYQTGLSGIDPKILIKGVHVKSMTVEAQTGNLYYADDDTEFIYVIGITKNGAYRKMLMKPAPEKRLLTNIQKIATDPLHRHVYWIDTNGDYNEGELRRMNFDGTNQKLLIKNMFYPRAITINIERNSLFFVDHIDIVDEISLTELQLDKDDNYIYPRKHVYNLKLSPFTNIASLEIDDPVMYIATTTQKEILQLNVNYENTSLIAVNGTPPFVRLTSVNVFKKDSSKKFSSIPNPCSSNACQHICLITSSNTSSCACADGYSLVDAVNCEANNETIKDEPPSYNNTCPQDQYVDVVPCLNISVPWSAPVWIDDNTENSKLNLTAPDISNWTEIGNHNYLYTATDEVGNVGHCSFTVFTTSLTWENAERFLPDLTTFLISKECRGEQLIINVSCKNRSLCVTHGAFQNKTLTNIWDSANSNLIQSKNSEITCQSLCRTTKSKNTGLDAGAIAGIIIAVSLVVVVGACFLYFQMRQKGSYPTTDNIPLPDACQNHQYHEFH
ncbi:low-density lipoprotein receptor-related protein 1-like isoform X2 [Clavelina lepadiformis]|uniref:low-density lipoprotein receptor-related protein 1-like isoform X2 n=1 Tax=Clavelina lepadiformis TaxID=159417 RepID=UPI004040FF0D